MRLHGRRTETWEARNDPATERYRYLYDEDELAEHLRRILELSHDKANALHIIFNNCHGNYAVTNAAELTGLLLDGSSGIAEGAGTVVPIQHRGTEGGRGSVYRWDRVPNA